LQTSKAKKKNNITVEQGCKTLVTIEWQDAPAFYMEECVGKKDTFDNKAFLEMFEVVHIEACGIREARDVTSSSSSSSSSSSR